MDDWLARRLRLPPSAAPDAFCSAARRAAASDADSRADKGARGMLLLSAGEERCCRLGRAVMLPLAARPGGEGVGMGMRVLGAACSKGGGGAAM